jgi:outer membrane immunogenic protein
MFNQRSRSVDDDGTLFGVAADNGGEGWFGTVQVGCDYQIGSNIVIGAFADYDWSGIKGNMVPGFLFNLLVGEEKLKSSWAAGGRIGWLPFERLLVYVSGGYTEARFDQVNFLFGPTGELTVFGLGKHTYSGWFIGAGYECGLGFLPGLFWKTEYRYADYGTERLNLLEFGDPNGTFVDNRKHVHTVRSELVWRFNWGSPVVARY